MCCGTSLYGAYSFSHGLAQVKPEYEQYITDRIEKNVRGITLLRGGIINGVRFNACLDVTTFPGIICR